MKKLLLFVLLLFPLVLQAQKSALLYGRITQAEAKETELMLITSAKEKGEAYPIRLQEDGSFSIQIPITESSYAKFKHGEEHTMLYLEPGDSIWLQLDSKSFDESLVYTGRGAGNNNYLSAHFLQFEDMQNQKYPSYIQLQQLAAKIEPAAYKILAKEQEESELALLKAYEDRLSVTFRQKRNWEMYYKWQGHLIDFPFWRAYFTTKQEKPFKLDQLDHSYFDFLDTVNLNNPAAEGIYQYHEYIFKVLGELSRLAKIGNDDKSITFEYQMQLATAHLKGYSLEHFQLQLLREQLFDLNLSSMEPYFRLLSASPYETVRTKSKQMLALAARLSPGQPVDFKLSNGAGQTIELSSYRGKILYIDFWASWCVPCIKEFPNSKALQEHYKDSPELVFLYISLDDEKEMWEAGLEKHQPVGDHYWIPGFKQEVPEYFDINSIPRYVLIDQQGKIIRSAAPRPGKPELKTLIDAALKNK